MDAAGAMTFPAYSPKGRSWTAVPLLLAVLAFHAALAAVVQAVTHPPRPLAAPLDPSAPVMVLIVSDGKGSGAHAADRTASFPALAPPPLAAIRAPADPFDEHVRDAQVDPRYIPSGKLDIGPLPAGAPDFASVTGHSLAIGKVTLRVYVSSFGLPDRVEVLGLPLDADFAQALRRALEQTTFLPGRLGGHDVAAYVDYEFQTEVVELPSPRNLRTS